ncbi:MAG: hypothetical protein ACFBZ8_12635 [Opitutales bacterium]
MTRTLRSVLSMEGIQPYVGRLCTLLLACLFAPHIFEGSPVISSGSIPPAASETHTVPTRPKSWIDIEIIRPYSEVPPGGYCAFLVNIRNASENTARFVFETEASLNYSGESGIRTLREALEVPANERRVFTVLAPVPAATVNSFRGDYDQVVLEVSMSGTGINGRSIRSFYTSYGSHSSGSFRRTTINEQQLASVGVYASLYSFYDYESVLNDFSQGAMVFNIGTLFDDWRAYAGFTHILLTRAEWEDQRPGARAALLEWVAAGGILHLLAPPGETSALAGLQAGPTGTSEPRVLRRGLGQVKIFNGEVQAAYDRCKQLTTPAVSNHFEENFFNVRPSLEQPSLPMRLEHNNLPEPLLERIQTIDTSSALIIVVAIAFAVAVGPINLFVLCSGRRRHRIFVYTPVFSIGAGVIVVMAILLGDGTGGSGHRATLVVEVDGANQLVVLREQASRTGLLFNNGFELPPGVMILPVHGGGETFYEDPRSERTYHQEGNDFNGDWFANRSVQAMTMLGTLPSRADLRIVGGGLPGGGNELQIESSINARCHEVYVRHQATGRQWRAENVGPGTTVRAQPITAAQFTAFIESQQTYYSPQLGFMLKQQTEDTLGNADWVYVARLEAFEEANWQTHDAIDWRRDRIVLVGGAEVAP